MRIYIDTSVINGLYAEDTPWIKEISKNFFESAKRHHKLYISDIVADEIRRTPELSKRKNLLDVLKKYACVELAKTRISVNSVNKEYGAIQIDICSPEEVD